MFLTGDKELGYDCRKLNKFIYQDRCRAKGQLCSYGCPFDAKRNARFFANEALEKGAELVKLNNPNMMLFAFNFLDSAKTY